MELSLTTGEEKFVSVETCTTYEAALAAGFQKRVGFVLTPRVLLKGEDNVGVEGGAGIAATVEKLHTYDHSLVPPPFIAFTLQK